MRTLRLAPVLAATLVVGCVVPGLPPPLSVARLARLPRPRTPRQGGKVSATAGVVTTGSSGGGQTSETGFDGEAALSLWLGPRYALTLTSTDYMSEAEGNLVLTHGPVHLGVLHGLGLAVAIQQGGPTIFAEANAGLLVQVPLGGGALVVAGRGSYDTVFVDARVGAAADAVGPGLQPYASATLSVAWVRPMGDLEVSPELTVMRRLPVVTSNDAASWVAGLLLTVSAPFPGPVGR